MTEQRFDPSRGELTVGEIVALTGARLRRGGDQSRRIRAISSPDLAGPVDLCFVDDPQATAALEATRAAACLTSPALADRVPERIAVLEVDEPYRAFIAVAGALFGTALRPSSLYGAGDDAGAFVHASARLETGVTIDPTAVVGPRAEIGTGTVVGPGAVIGPDVRIGRDCAIGATTTVVHALVGDQVSMQAGCHIGQDGLAVTRQPGGLQPVPQLGRVIVQDHVRIGTGSVVDRGQVGDTVVGEGSKIDNLVQIGHDAVIGRHCLVAAQVGLAADARLGDFVVLGPRVVVLDRLVVGEGARVGAACMVIDNVPSGGILAATPSGHAAGSRPGGRA